MNKFESFLATAGKDFAKGLTVVMPFAQAAGQAVTLINPEYGALIQTTVATVIATEQKFAAAGQQSQSGTHKLLDVVTILEPVVLQILKGYGIEADNSHVVNYVNAVVGLLNNLPAIPAKA
jgi:hypothetical protein